MTPDPTSPIVPLPAGLLDRVATRAADDGLLDAAFARTDSPVGELVLVATERGLARVAFHDFNGGEDAIVEAAAKRLGARVLRVPRRLDAARRELEEFFAGERRGFDLALDLAALTNAGFGRAILEQTARIPFGETRSYKDVATAAGSPGAVRAAGNALGRNPLPIVVPCHRVLRSGGGLGGYTGGLDVKRTLLRVEGHPQPEPLA